MKLLLIALLFSLTSLFASPYIEQDQDQDQDQYVDIYQDITVYSVAGEDGQDGVNGTNGTNGTNGVDGKSADTVLYNKLRSTSTALSSVELNPDHEGFSVGIGGSSVSGQAAGAIGLMYGWQYETGTSVGFNVKAYTGEAGYNGVGAGVTIGF